MISSSEKEEEKAVTVNGTVQLREKDGQLTRRANITVIEKGRTGGTVTDENGGFSIQVAGPEAVLIVSYIGYKTVEFPLAGQTRVDIVLDIQENEMQDVVVTALGINRQKKTLTYATQNLKGEDLSNTREVNLTSAMNGKVAGLTISKTNSGPGSSNRIIFRGNRSVSGNNQPLIVIDGVRIDNAPKALADVTNFGTRDNGDGISSINPDDVESMNVLTGASAAALYGSDAANGVIIITTKKGRSGHGIGIQYSGSYSLENPLIYPEMQNEYGQGDGGAFVIKSENSWGPKMTGQSQADWSGKSQAFSPQPDNVKDFFNTGNELINSIAASTGNEKSQTYFSYTNTLSNGIIPNNSFKRNNLNLRQTAKLSPQLTLDAKANFISEDVINRPKTAGANYAIATLFTMPRSLRLSDIKNSETVKDDGSLVQNYWSNPSPNYQNPYWSVNRNLYDKKRNRFIGLISLKYQISPDLSIQGRSSLDYYTDNSNEKDFNDTYWLSQMGNYIVTKESNSQFNNDLLLSYTKNLSDAFSLDLNAGASIEHFNFEGTIANNNGLSAPNLFSLKNALALSNTDYISRWEKQSVYASAEFGYNKYLYLDLTGRNDWNSTLPVKNSSYFFPSAGLTAIFSDMFHLPDFVSLLKARTSYAFVGNGTGFNQLKPSYQFTPGGNGGFILIDNVLHNADLKPEETRSFEAGIDFSLFKDRFGAQLTYYHTNTINQILSIGVPNPSGYAFRIINAGKIMNEGVEFLVNAKPVLTKNFRWTISLNFGANRNKIIALDSVLKSQPLASPETFAEIDVVEGKGYGDIYVSAFKRNASGQIIVDANGVPEMAADKIFAGNYNPRWTAGITNTFQYRSWSLSFLIDERNGGVIVSRTQAALAAAGVSRLTGGDRAPFVVPNSVAEDGSKNSVAVAPEAYWSSIGGGNPIGEAFTYSSTSIRLRELNLTYSLPAKTLGKGFVKGASLSLVGRNLFFLKNDGYGFDPESAIGTGNNQGTEFMSIPSTRSYGVFLRFNF